MKKQKQDEGQTAEQKFYELQSETIEKVEQLLSKMAMPFAIKIKMIGNSKQKAVVKMSKLNDINQFLTGFDLLLTINEEYLEALDKDSSDILIYQELDRLSFNIAKGQIKITKWPLQTTSGVLKKWGIDLVAKANQLSELYTQQKQDGQEFNAAEIEQKIKKSKKEAVSFDEN